MKLIDMVKKALTHLTSPKEKHIELIQIKRHNPDPRYPTVITNDEEWHINNGMRITVHTLHDGFRTGSMYSVDHARYLAAELNNACDKIERQL